MPLEHRHERGGGAEGLVGQRAADALGVAGGARRVQHGEALELLVERLAGVRRDELVVGRVARAATGVADHQPQVDVGREGDQFPGQRLQRRDVMRVWAPQSLTMYAASSAVRCVLTMV